MRVSAAACSRVIVFRSRCARSCSPRLGIVLGHPIDLAHLAGALRWSDDAVLFHDVDEPARAREADRHLALQHRHRRLAGALDDLDCLFVAVVVDLVATVLAHPCALLVLEDGHVVVRLALLPPVTDDLLDLRIGNEGALGAHRLRRVRREPEHVAAPQERCVPRTRWIPVARASWATRVICFSTWIGAWSIRSASSSMMKTTYGTRSEPVCFSLYWPMLRELVRANSR